MTTHDPSFKEWLFNFINTDTNLGDLAVDVKKDRTFPDSSDKEILMGYIRNRTPDKCIHDTLSAAIDLYNAASGVHEGLSHRVPHQM